MFSLGSGDIELSMDAQPFQFFFREFLTVVHCYFLGGGADLLALSPRFLAAVLSAVSCLMAWFSAIEAQLPFVASCFLFVRESSGGGELFGFFGFVASMGFPLLAVSGF